MKQCNNIVKSPVNSNTSQCILADGHTGHCTSDTKQVPQGQRFFGEPLATPSHSDLPLPPLSSKHSHTDTHKLSDEPPFTPFQCNIAEEGIIGLADKIEKYFEQVKVWQKWARDKIKTQQEEIEDLKVARSF